MYQHLWKPIPNFQKPRLGVSVHKETVEAKKDLYLYRANRLHDMGVFVSLLALLFFLAY